MLKDTWPANKHKRTLPGDVKNETRHKTVAKQQIVSPGAGASYEWANDHVHVKTSIALADGRVTVVEDHLKPGFFLARHHHKKMIEIFYVLEGSVEFTFDDESVVAGLGTTLNVPPGIWHAVTSPGGAKLLTIFCPGGFDDYLEELVALTEAQYGDADFMRTLSEKYDIFEH
jgi:mannose-6-phosphate isomerase-like protein (cupin superfamily)